MTTHEPQAEALDRSTSLRYLLGGSLSEGLAGAGAVAVAIIALASGSAMTLMAIATILVGGALIFEGGAIAARFASLLHETSEGRLDAMEFGTGMTAQVIGGVGVTTLGILALLGIAPTSLVSVAAIVAGGSVLLGAGTTARLNAVKINRSGGSEESKGLAHGAVSSASGVQLFIGIGAITLGILGVLGISPNLLSTIAMLGVGFAVLMGGAAISGLAMAIRR